MSQYLSQYDLSVASMIAGARLKRVDRWLAYDGRGLAPVSYEAAVLLDRRLQLRRRANWVLVAVGGLGVAVFVVGFVTAQFGSGNEARDVAVRWWAAGVVLISIGALCREWLVARGERRLAATLTRRVSSGMLVTLWSRLGRDASIMVMLVVAADLGLLLGLILLNQSALLIATYAAALTITLGCVVATTRQLLTSPTVAVDESSLAIDQRLRMRDLVASVGPLALLASPNSIPTGRLEATDPSMFWLRLVAVGVWVLYILFGTITRQASKPTERPVGLDAFGRWQ